MNEKNFRYMYFLVEKVLDDESKRFEVVGNDGFKWGDSSSPKGALFDALAVGINLKDIEIGMYVPDFGEVLQRANG